MDTSRLSQLENEAPRRNSRRVVLLALCVLCALTVSDWVFRCTRYQWHQRVVRITGGPVQQTAAPREAVTRQIPATRGGDLSRLIGIAHVARQYEEERPAGSMMRDAHGYPNPVLADDRFVDVVVVGDSFMATGRYEDLFATQLAAQTALTVYTHALMGHGPFASLERFVDNPRFQVTPPTYLVWGFAEREITGAFFDRFARRFQQHRARRAVDDPPARETAAVREAAPRRIRVDWAELAPAQLRQSLPATSILAQSAEWIWTRLRYYLFRQTHPWVTPADRKILGGPMLFYSYHIETIHWPQTKRAPERVAEVIAEVDAWCRQQGIHLIVLLIPEKEQVYREWIPAQALDAPPPSPLAPLAQALAEHDVRVINLLPPFRQAMEAGELVYWRDDTHWNAQGIRIAAEQVRQVIRQGLAEPASDGF